MYRIIQADDHALVREGIKRILLEDPDLCVIGETGNGQELLGLVEEKNPDMVLLDISMPGLSGLEAIKLIKQSHPKVKILVLTIHKNKEYIYLAMKDGADGYLLKEETCDVLRTAIRTIRQDQIYISLLI